MSLARKVWQKFILNPRKIKKFRAPQIAAQISPITRFKNDSIQVSCSRHRTTNFPNSESPIFTKKTLFICLINSRARHSAIYILKSRNLFYFFLNLKEASKCVLRIIKKNQNKNFVVNIGDSEFGNLVVR